MSLNFDNTEIAFSSKKMADLRKAHFLFSAMAKPWLTQLGISMTQFAFKFYLPIKGLVKSTIFRQFCGGETLEEANESAVDLNKYGISIIMDYGVEGKDEEAEFEKTATTFMETIKFAADKTYIPFVSLKFTGFCRFQLLEKMNKSEALSKDEEKEYERFLHRVDKICNGAALQNKMILIDAEESWIQIPVDAVADLMMAKYNMGKVVVFNTFQLYRHDRLAFLKESYEKARQKGYILGAKLVRGAYMEKERARALELQYPSPIQETKEQSDRDYDLAVRYCIENIEGLALFIGTHNEKSCQLATEIITQKGLAKNHPHIHFSQLYGMSDNISFNLAKEGFLVSKYLPYGPVADVIPYLMRRAQENTSVAGQMSRELTLLTKEIKRRKAR